MISPQIQDAINSTAAAVCEPGASETLASEIQNRYGNALVTGPTGDIFAIGAQGRRVPLAEIAEETRRSLGLQAKLDFERIRHDPVLRKKMMTEAPRLYEEIRSRWLAAQGGVHVHAHGQNVSDARSATVNMNEKFQRKGNA